VGETERRCDGGTVVLCDRCRAGWHDLGERESVQRRGVAGGDRLGVAGGGSGW
jgi:hypothetical protein